MPYRDLYRNKLCIKQYREEHKEELREYSRNYYKLHYKDRWKPTNELTFNFLGRLVTSTFRQITGYCSKCPNNIYDDTCKITHMHHYFYLSCMPWACREELCARCHAKIHSKKRT